MIRILASGKIKAGKLEDLIEVAIPLVEGSRNEAGNISYALNQNTQNPNEICFIEEWKDQKAIDIHNETIHFKTAVAKLGGLLDGGLDIKLYQIIV